jgi:hypothetical protein
MSNNKDYLFKKRSIEEINKILDIKTVKYVLLGGYCSNSLIQAKVAEILGTKEFKRLAFCYDGGAISEICYTGEQEFDSDFAWRYFGNGFLEDWFDEIEETSDNPFFLINQTESDNPIHIKADLLIEHENTVFYFLGMLTGYNSEENGDIWEINE